MSFFHGGRGTPEYSSWQAMLNRCRNPRVKDFKNYGAKGITVCERWKSFENFREDMGYRPLGMTLDRIDSTKGYEPGNVRWATRIEQGRNKANLVFVQTPHGVMPLVVYAASIGLTRGAAHLRLQRGKLEGCVRYVKKVA